MAKAKSSSVQKVCNPGFMCFACPFDDCKAGWQYSQTKEETFMLASTIKRQGHSIKKSASAATNAEIMKPKNFSISL